MNRPTAYRRHKRAAKINRKKNIIKTQRNYWYYKHDGTLDKGKIHCSCWMCRHKFYDRAKQSDIRQADSMLFDLRGIDDSSVYNTATRRINHRVRR